MGMDGMEVRREEEDGGLCRFRFPGAYTARHSHKPSRAE